MMGLLMFIKHNAIKNIDKQIIVVKQENRSIGFAKIMDFMGSLKEPRKTIITR